MSKYELKLPKLGESILNATIVRWLKQEGESVSLDEPICEVATDKVNSEIPSPVDGVIQTIKANVDQTIDVGQIMAIIETDQQVEEKVEQSEETSAATTSTVQNDFLSPSVLRLAKEHSISMSQLEKISGSGANGRVTKEDVIAFAQKKRVDSADGERMSLTPLRKAIAKSVSNSFFTAPHAFLMHTIDLTELTENIALNKAAFLKKNGVKLTLTAPICQCLAMALQEFPQLNASFDEDSLILHPNINLGIAVSVENGVIVPIIQNCNRKSIEQIAQDIQQFAKKVRDKESVQEDLEGGTFTLTNFGMSGVEMGLPIIREGEIGILGLGALVDSPSVVNNKLEIRKKMKITLSFDHRAIDGMLGCSFINRFQQLIEDFRI